MPGGGGGSTSGSGTRGRLSRSAAGEEISIRPLGVGNSRPENCRRGSGFGQTVPLHARASKSRPVPVCSSRHREYLFIGLVKLRLDVAHRTGEQPEDIGVRQCGPGRVQGAHLTAAGCGGSKTRPGRRARGSLTPATRSRRNRRCRSGRDRRQRSEGPRASVPGGVCAVRGSKRQC